MIYRLYAQLGRIVGRLETFAHRKRISGFRRALPGHTLYHFWVSPYARRVRLTVYRLGIDIPFKDVLLDARAYEELIRHGGKDQVPCLKIESGGEPKWLYESKDIIAYLQARVGEASPGPRP